MRSVKTAGRIARDFHRKGEATPERARILPKISTLVGRTQTSWLRFRGVFL